MSKRKVHYGLVSIITTLLISLVVFALSGLSINKVSATDFTLDITDTLIELSLPSSTISLDLEFTNGENTAFTTADYNVAVGTNNTTGYYLSMNTDTNQLTRTASITDSSNNTTTPTIDPIPLVSGGYTIDSFKTSNDTINKWGYSVGTSTNNTTTTNFYPMDDTRNTILNYNRTSINKDTTTITFATKVDATKPSGTYTTNINFTAVANPTPLYYMQEVSTWCPTLTTDQTIEAIDTRDYKTYYVAKLKDGNCWMTENLDYDISTDTILTSNDTDLPEGTTWIPMRSTYATSDTNWAWPYAAPESYDPGDKCWNGVIRNDWNGTLDNSTISCSDSSANKHYSIGNYYNWTAAVAMNDSSSYTTDGQDTNQSICPAGWRLPTYSGDKSYQNLGSILGLTASQSGNIHISPIYFVYGGGWEGQLVSVGSLGIYVSDVVFSSTKAIGLYYSKGSSYLWPLQSVSRAIGYPIRCVSR